MSVEKHNYTIIRYGKGDLAFGHFIDYGENITLDEFKNLFMDSLIDLVYDHNYKNIPELMEVTILVDGLKTKQHDKIMKEVNDRVLKERKNNDR